MCDERGKMRLARSAEKLFIPFHAPLTDCGPLRDSEIATLIENQAIRDRMGFTAKIKCGAEVIMYLTIGVACDAPIHVSHSARGGTIPSYLGTND